MCGIDTWSALSGVQVARESLKANARRLAVAATRWGATDRQELLNDD
jgi:hypothetical protein